MKRGYTILYADNDLHTKRILSNYFDKYFDEVFETTSASDTLKVHKNNSPDVILIDINIPKSNEIEIIKKIRKKDTHTPIIVFTSNLETTNLLAAVKLNLVDYIPKPLESDSFQDAIKRSLELANVKKDEVEFETIQISKTSYWNKKKKLFFYKNRILELTKNERLLFELLINKKNEIVEPEEISMYVWNIQNDNLKDASIRNLVKRLRKKLPIDIVRSIYGSGYIMSF